MSSLDERNAYAVRSVVALDVDDMSLAGVGAGKRHEE